MIVILRKRIALMMICLSILMPCLQVASLYVDLPCAYASSTGVSFKYKKGYSVNGSKQGIYHYLKKGKPTLALTYLSGASKTNKVKVKLYGGGKYYGTLNFSKKGKQTYSCSVPKGRYYLIISVGCGYKKWINGTGKITPVYN